jgi:drug/metabolite transporter (DMT)-like permease
LEAVLAALSESIYLNLGRPVRAHMSLLPLMLPIFFFAFVSLSLTGLVVGSPLGLPPDLRATLALLGLGLIPTALGHSLYFASLSKLRSYETAGLALLEPVGATLLAGAIFGEVPAPLSVGGGALILVGLWFVLRHPAPAAPAP